MLHRDPLRVLAMLTLTVASVGACAPDEGLDGDWTVDTWTLTRAIGASMPNPLASGGTDSPACGTTAQNNYRAQRITIGGGGTTVTVNGRACEPTLSGATITARCGCGGGGGFVVCSSVLTLRLDGTRLRGEETHDFNSSSPAYCTTRATLDASRL
jgi:hypothetical protein